MLDLLKDTLIVVFIVIGIARVAIRVGGLIVGFEDLVERLLVLIAVPLIVVAILGPAAVLIATRLGIVDSDSFLWTLRNNSFISVQYFLSLCVPLASMGVLYAALWSSLRPLPQFVALLLSRLTGLYGLMVLAVYSAILIQGGYNLAMNLLMNWYSPPFSLGGVLEVGAWWVYVLDEIVDKGPFIIGAILGTTAGVLCGLAPIVWFHSGIVLTHQLFRYYYPWQLARRARLWPPSGYNVEFGDPQRVDVLLGSDLHVTDAGAQTLEPKRRSEPTDSLGLLDDIIKRFCPSLVMVTGDLTDTGSQTQWERVAERLPGAYELVLVPGNHDYHFRHLASGKMLAAFWLPASFSTDEVSERIKRVSPEQGGFPLLYRSKHLDLDVLTLDSNMRSSGWPLTNAVGMIGGEQLSKAKDLLLGRDCSRALIIALHHHVIPPPFTVSAPFLLCLDRDAVLRLALEHQAAAIVHGHTHQPFVYRHRSGLLIISCGSACFDANGPFAEVVQRPSCYGLQLDAGTISGIKLLRSVQGVLCQPTQEMGRTTCCQRDRWSGQIRVLKNDVKYRFVIEMASLAKEAA